MDVNTGELRRVSEEQWKALYKDFTPVPQNLQTEAEKALGDKESVFVDLESASPLADWAKAERNKPHPGGNRKHRRMMAKQSRKKNR